jgi:hypothetical protein
VENVTEYFAVNVFQVRAGPAKSSLSDIQPTPLAPRSLENDGLTILTGCAEALAEGLVYDPDCVEALLADAQGKTQWRAKLGLPEPSPQLSQAMHFVSQVVHAIDSLNGNLTLDALHASLREDRPAEEHSIDWCAACSDQHSNRSALNSQQSRHRCMATRARR